MFVASALALPVGRSQSGSEAVSWGGSRIPEFRQSPRCQDTLAGSPLRSAPRAANEEAGAPGGEEQPPLVGSGAKPHEPAILVYFSPERGIKLLGLLLTGSTGQRMASRNGLA